MLTVAVAPPLRLQEDVVGQCPFLDRRLKVARELAEVAVRRVRDVGDGGACEGQLVIAVYGPRRPLLRERGEDARRCEGRLVVAQAALRRCHRDEGAVGEGLRRRGTEPLVADGVAAREARQDGQHLRRVDAHDVARLRAGQSVCGETRLVGDEVFDEALVTGRALRVGRVGRVLAEELDVRVRKALAGICAREEVAERVALLDAEDLDGLATLIRVGLAAFESLERVAERRDVAAVCVEEAEHVVERAILKHQHDDVLDL